MNIRGQSAFEFVLLVIAALFMVTTFLLAFQTNTASTIDKQRDFTVKETALTVKDEIVLAVSAGDGYSRSFRLPADIQGLAYNASILDDFVFVQTLDGRHAVAYPIENVSGQLVVGENVIANRAGRVVLNG